MDKKQPETMEITLEVLVEAEKSFLLKDSDDGHEGWIPKVCIRYPDVDNIFKDESYDFEIDTWVLEDRGFII